VTTLTIGLPVYNGERYLRESLDALLAQTWTDFELVISDNASTDSTADICTTYANRDERIRYVRQPVNVGAGPNHNLLVPLARGRYFKWASHDDLYAERLLEKCIGVLDGAADVVLAHSWDAVIDDAGKVLRSVPYDLATDDPDPAVRLRSLLRTPGGNDFYGVIRTDVLRRVGPHRSYYNADRTFMAGLVVRGRFRQVPEVLYHRRDHPGRASRAGAPRDRAAALDPRRARPLRHVLPVMYAEYVAGMAKAVMRAPLPPRDRARCLREVASWLTDTAVRGHRAQSLEDELDSA
jgi:glycosyltransferase involved in cell wall biosynthesis